MVDRGSKKGIKKGSKRGSKRPNLGTTLREIGRIIIHGISVRFVSTLDEHRPSMPWIIDHGNPLSETYPNLRVLPPF